MKWGLHMNLGVKKGGAGRHEAYVLEFEPKAMTITLQALFVTEFLYGIIIALEKTSILLLYIRIFGIHAWFRRLTWGLIVYIWMWGISESVVAVFQCSPVRHQWDVQTPGTCINQTNFYRWIPIPNVLHDLVMLLAPVPIVWGLQIGVRQKMAITMIFVTGSL
jgi:hypothetical protein